MTIMYAGVLGGSQNPNFATTLYTGNGGTQSIVTGKNNSAGSLTWIKRRDVVSDHWLIDVTRGASQYLRSNTTSEQTPTLGAFSFTSNGFNLGNSDSNVNANASNYVAWTFLEAAGFFDVVSYTGNNSSGAQSISHNLTVKPECLIVKNLSANSDWRVFHTNLAADGVLKLNTSGAAVSVFPPIFSPSNNNSSQFYVAFDNNITGNNYIAYLFAHNPSKKIACDVFTTDGAGEATVTCGFRPQWVLFKSSTVTGGTNDWYILDTARGWGAGNDNDLRANLANAEGTSVNYGEPTSSGFTIDSLSSSTSFVYIAIG